MNNSACALKVARTISDLADERDISPQHVVEAVHIPATGQTDARLILKAPP